MPLGATIHLAYGDREDGYEDGYECSECGYVHRFMEHAAECCYEYPGEDDDYSDDEDGAELSLGQVENVARRAAARTDAETMLVPRLPNRPGRMVSCEQELARGYTLVRQVLMACANPYSVFDCRHDGSLPDGGVEVVFDCLKLWDPSVAQAYHMQLNAVRSLVADGSTKVTYACGHHVHVSAKDENGRMLTPRGLANLYGIFCHLEDCLYRLAAATWQGHRGTNYAHLLDKSGAGRVSAIGKFRAMRDHNAERYQGLNILPTMHAVRRCRCGAGELGLWSDCDCGSMGLATIEFRLWNGSTRPDVIHAWILLSVAIVEYATRDDVPVDLPSNEWTGNGDGDAESLTRQLSFIVDRLPLTHSERAEIIALARLSPSAGMRQAADKVDGRPAATVNEENEQVIGQ
jgi:hypothetical protein